MAQQTERKVSKAPSEEKTNKKYTAAELNQIFDEKAKKRIENYEAAQSAAKGLRDITKNQSKTISTFNKDLLRTYLQNIGSNEDNLRNLSWFLYYRSMTYMRVCNFYANLLELDYRSLIPAYEIDNVDADSMKTSLIETDDLLNLWHINKTFRDIALICVVQDIFGGIWIEDDTGLFIWQIPAKYVKIAGQYMTGDFSIAMDVSYLRSRQELIEYMPEPLDSMYKEYQSSGQKWQIVPDEYSIAVKWRCEDYESIVPPLLPAFNSIINLSDLEDQQALAEKLSIFKMIWMEMETINSADMPDEFKVSTDMSIEYFTRMINDALPDYVSAALVPGKLETISFDDQADKDTNKVMKATEAVLNSIGSAEVLNGATISGAEAFRTAQIVSSDFVLKPLLPQVQAIINRHLSYSNSNPCKTVFHKVTSLTKASFDEKVLSSAQNGYPSKLLLGATLGLSVKDTLSLNTLEEEVLGLTELFKPLSTSYTQSGNADSEGGRPKDTAQTTDGEASEEKRDKSNG